MLAADAVLFAAPTALLARACGAGPAVVSSVVLVPALAFLGGSSSPELRRQTLALGIVLVQGISAVAGISEEARGPRSWERRAAVVLAGAAVLSAFFLRSWADVAAAGAAVHVFVLGAYLRHGRRENRRDLDRVPGPAVDERPPSAEDQPRPEAVEKAEERPDGRGEDPRGEDREGHDHTGRDGC